MFYEIKIFLLSKSITKNSQQYQRCMTWLTVHRHIWPFVVIYDFLLMDWNAWCGVDEDVNGRRRIILAEDDNNNDEDEYDDFETRDEECREKKQKIIIMRLMLEFLMLKIILQLMILMIKIHLWITSKQNEHIFVHTYSMYTHIRFILSLWFYDLWLILKFYTWSMNERTYHCTYVGTKHKVHVLCTQLYTVWFWLTACFRFHNIFIHICCACVHISFCLMDIALVLCFL